MHSGHLEKVADEWIMLDITTWIYWEYMHVCYRLPLCYTECLIQRCRS